MGYFSSFDLWRESGQLLPTLPFIFHEDGETQPQGLGVPGPVWGSSRAQVSCPQFAALYSFQWQNGYSRELQPVRAWERCHSRRPQQRTGGNMPLFVAPVKRQGISSQAALSWKKGKQMAISRNLIALCEVGQGYPGGLGGPG